MFLLHFRRLVERLQTSNGCPVKVNTVVITVPPYFTSVERRATELSAAMAGMERVKILDDSLAAVLPYIEDFPYQERKVFILDSSQLYTAAYIMSVDKSEAKPVHVTLLSSHYSKFLRIKDIENRISGHVIDKFKKIDTFSEPASIAIVQHLLHACKQITGHGSETIEIPPCLVEGKCIAITITPSRLATLCSDLFRRIIVPIEEVLEDAGLTALDVADVIIIGCGRFVPQLTDVLMEVLPPAHIHATIDPRIAVAEGAALMASNLLSGNETSIEIKEWFECQFRAQATQRLFRLVLNSASIHFDHRSFRLLRLYGSYH
ncbi:major heat shock 70 kDa protein Ab-like isoform X1 [Paramacrobiotus metropolitanus]|uniref:major heat shock 70 kDa protein Ab-like isoform X1 n=1 Tax=Paramacrobiotus metropolitanus TaxID=2943436 RepID=UPI002445DDAB|nr:major heat shock 70 kDa protein Ab-like isoform X1 [Paramacrobiotus metropolitanus]